MTSAWRALCEFVNFVGLTMRLYLPIFVVEPSFLVTLSCGGCEMCSAKNRLDCFRK